MPQHPIPFDHAGPVQPRRRMLATGLALAASPWLAPGAAQAQPDAASWPSRPVRVIVPYAPGNISDSSARDIAVRLGTALGQQLFVDNKAGANTQIGSDQASRAAPDGYTWLYTGPILTVMGALFERLPFDPAHDLVPVAQAIANPTVFVVGRDFPARDMREFIALTQREPGKYFVASGGIGTMPHMAHELLVASAGMQTQHVPYKGGSTFVPDLLSGRVTGVFDNPSSAIPMIRDGRLKALAVTSLARSPALPDVPTLDEQGVPGFEVMNWFGFFAPARTPAALLDRMNAEVAKVMRLPEVVEHFAKIGVAAVGGSRAAFERIVSADMAKWARIVKERNIRPE